MAGYGDRPGGSSGSGQLQVPDNTNTPDPGVSVYSEISSVAAGSEVNILTFAVPSAPPYIHILRVEFGGCLIGQYRLRINGTVEAQHYTVWTQYNGEWDFKTSTVGGLKIAAGSTINVTVIHQRPDAGEFYARLQYLEVN